MGGCMSANKAQKKEIDNTDFKIEAHDQGL